MSRRSSRTRSAMNTNFEQRGTASSKFVARPSRSRAGVLLVEERTRLARDEYAAHDALRTFAHAGVRVLYADGSNGNGASDPAAMLLDGIGHAVAAYDRRVMVARMAAGRQSKAQRAPRGRREWPRCLLRKQRKRGISSISVSAVLIRSAPLTSCAILRISPRPSGPMPQVVIPRRRTVMKSTLSTNPQKEPGRAESDADKQDAHPEPSGWTKAFHALVGHCTEVAAAITLFIGTVVLLAIGLCSAVAWVLFHFTGDTNTALGWTAIGTLGVAFVAFELVIYLAARATLDQKRQHDREEALDARGTAEFTARDQANQKVLRLWEEMVRRQAATTYRHTMVAMGAAFLIVVVGTVLVVSTGDVASKAAVAGLSGIGAAMSGLIGHTFLTMHRIEQEQLNFYFIEPLVTNYLLNAERVIRDFEKEKLVEQKSDLYQKLVGAGLEIAKGSLQLRQSSGESRRNGSTPTASSTPKDG